MLNWTSVFCSERSMGSLLQLQAVPLGPKVPATNGLLPRGSNGPVERQSVFSIQRLQRFSDSMTRRQNQLCGECVAQRSYQHSQRERLNEQAPKCAFGNHFQTLNDKIGIL